MGERPTLQISLNASPADDKIRAATISVIEALADAAAELSLLIAAGPLAGITGKVDGANVGGDAQKDLDILADQLMMKALEKSPVAGVVSEEAEVPVTLNPDAPLCVAIDPLDGSSNIETNISVGTIFSIRPKSQDAVSTFFEPGTIQCAAGFFIYGPQTCLVLAFDKRVDIFLLDPSSRRFVLIKGGVQIPESSSEFAINASNRRHWSSAIRGFIDECLAGSTGVQGRDFNMRWIASLVAEAYRILVRGGVFLYPADARKGYREGRLRLVYEAHPMALIMEWAGGRASSGRARILELSARSPHQRAPLIMGSARTVRDIDILHEGDEPLFESSDSPLFARRGFFR